SGAGRTPPRTGTAPREPLALEPHTASVPVQAPAPEPAADPPAEEAGPQAPESAGVASLVAAAEEAEPTGVPRKTVVPEATAAGASTEPAVPADESGAGDRGREGPFTPPLEVQSRPAAPRPTPKKRSVRPAAPVRKLGEVVLTIQGLTKRFGSTVAVDDLDLEVRQGSFYGIVGPNGAGKTTTLSMVTGLLRPDSGGITVHGIDVWREPERAKRTIGVLPDALRLFDRLTGAQLLYYSGTLRGLDGETVRQRSADLVTAFGLEDAAGRLVTDYSAGMTKKIALAAAMIHSPRLLVLDEPFESVDPVSAANLNEILQRYVEGGGTVVLSSHGMDFIQRVCDHVAVIVAGRVLASGTMDEVRGENTLEERFVELAGGRKAAQGMEWLHSFSDAEV
ncbi:MAG: ATP-binding cassette protein, partial [Naasia sp.]|nr:ATP-binding cassette protein [Naasia sp.]